MIVEITDVSVVCEKHVSDEADWTSSDRLFHVARLMTKMPANKVLRLHVNTSLSRPPDQSCNISLVDLGVSGRLETTLTDLSETSGTVLFAADMMVQ